ncbi:MMPL family transporter [Mycobacterium sp. pUA109]|uniref:MMPL family transporter n=1 Tax=Mycobacterium sp. pUA109 TaxID=3238982 RepID=UPI00351B7EB6
MLGKIAWAAGRFPRGILAAAFLFLVAATTYGAPAASKLPSGGYDVPQSESARAEAVLDKTFRAGGLPIVFTISTPDGAHSAAAQARGLDVVQALQACDYVHQVASYWTSPPPLRGALLSADQRTALVVARVEGGDRDAPVRAHDISQPLVGSRDNVTVKVGGQAMAYYEGSQQSRADLLKLEAVAVPLTALALVWIFGSLVAAILPLVVALIAVAATTACLWAIHHCTDVSIFAVNLATASGLAFAIDYTLFIVNRYREERAHGVPDTEALARTLNTAGRTVVFSGLTMAVTLATLLLFKPYLLKSMAYAGLASVGFATLAALCVTPALIVVCGDRIDALDIRVPVRRWLGRKPAAGKLDSESVWYRIATSVMRRPVLVLIAVAVVLFSVGSPILGMKLAYPDDRALPTSAQTRQTGDLVRDGFTTNFAGTVSVVLPDIGSAPTGIGGYAAKLSRVADVVSVAAPDGIYAGGVKVSAAVGDTGITSDAAYLSVTTTRDPYSEAGQRQLAELKSVPAPAPALFGGIAQRDNDNVGAIADRAPSVIALVALATLALMFLMTGSVILPVKALITNALSLTAAFGAVVWIFQDGHLHGLGTVATGHLTAFVLPTLAAIAYALSMDYEVFVLSRVREEWLNSEQTSAANQRSVGLGLARTGRIVTAAALVMTVVFIAIAAGEVAFMRGLGVGLTVAVLVDAFVVRTILVPAAMAVMGRFNWWAPTPLRRWHNRWGATEQPHSTAHEPVVSATPYKGQDHDAR